MANYSEEDIKLIKNAIIEALKQSGFGGATGAGMGGMNVTELFNLDMSDFDKFKQEYVERHRKLRNAEENRRIDEINEQINKLNGVNTKLAEQKKADLEQEKEKITKGINQRDEEQYKEQQRIKLRSKLNNIITIADGLMDVWVAFQTNYIRKSRNVFEKSEKLFQAEMAKAGTYISGFSAAVSSIVSDSATESQINMAKAARENAKAQMKFLTDTQMAERQYVIAEKERTIETSQNIVSAANKIAGAALAIGAAGAAETAGISFVVGAIVAAGAELVAIYNKYKKVDIEGAKLINEIYEKLAARTQSMFDQIGKVIEPLDTVTKSVVDFARKNETIFKSLGVTMGYAEDTYSSYMQTVMKETTKFFGLTGEQMQQMQKSYVEQSGRNVLIGVNGYNQIEAVSRVFGISNSEVASMIGQMNIFNTSISDGYDIMNDMWHLATKMGISTSKYSKEFANNLKLAQSYNFRGGVDNMAKLTMWAEKTRFNLQNATKFADKMGGDNISDILETSAKLQILGGAAGIYSDPMAMMWEAGNDVGALAQRQFKMFGDITGTFNKQTGETEFTEFERRKIRGIADIMGISLEEAMNQIRQSNKQGVIDKALEGYKLTDTQRTALGLRATYKQGTGFVVNTTQGEMTIQDLASQGGNIEQFLLPEDTDSAIMDIAKNVRSMEQMEAAHTANWNAIMSEETIEKIKELSQASMEATDLIRNTIQQTGQISSQINNYIESGNAIAKRTHDMLTDPKNKQLIDDYRNAIVDSVASISNLPKSIYSAMAIISSKGMDYYNQVLSEIADITGSKTSSNDKQKRTHALKEQYKNDRNTVDFIEATVPYNDAVGKTNGGIISAGSVKPINDGVGTLVKTHEDDQFMAAKTGGPIDKLFDIVGNIISNKNNKNSDKLTIEFNGNLNLKDNSGNINLVDIMRNDPVIAREFMRLMMKTMDSQNGKPTTKHNI